MQAPTPHPGSIQPGATSIRRQHGSMAIAMMLMLLGLISILGIVEVGYLYWAHRDAQKVADLAALSGAQQLNGPACPTGSPAYVAASGNATDNGGTPANGYSGIDISCGRQPAGGSSILAPASASSVAAIKVVANRSVNHIFGMAWKSTFPIKAEAVAINSQPIAAFSVGSALLKLDLLKNLLGSTLDTSIGLSVLSSNGIANASVSLLDIINNIHKNIPSIDIGTVQSVLSAPITLDDFLNAYVEALPQGTDTSIIEAWISDIDKPITNSAGAKIILGDTEITLGDILNANVNTSDPQTALNATISAADILQTAILVADSKHALSLPATSIDIPGIASIDLSLSVIEPPQIGVGGVGTTAHTAQIRLAADISALSVVNLGGQPVSDLSVAIEVAPSEGTIKDITCNVPSASGVTDNVTISVAPKAASVGILSSSYATKIIENTSQSWSSILDAAEADKANGWDTVVNVLNIATIQLFVKAPVQTTPDFSHSFEVDPSKSITNEPNGIIDTTGMAGMTYPPSLDSDPATDSSLLISSLFGPDSDIQATGSILGLKFELGDPLKTLSPLLNNLLAPVLQDVVNPLLQAVGLEIGTAQVNLRSVTCNPGAQLVY